MRNLDRLPTGKAVPRSRAVAEKIANPAIPRPLTLGVLARATGLTAPRLSNLLSGRSMPGLLHLIVLAGALGLTLDQAWNGLRAHLGDTPAWRVALRKLERRPARGSARRRT